MDKGDRAALILFVCLETSQVVGGSQSALNSSLSIHEAEVREFRQESDDSTPKVTVVPELQKGWQHRYDNEKNSPTNFVSPPGK